MNKKIDEIINRKYPIEIHFIIEEDGDGYYLAFLLDFGWCACSATGDTVQEVLDSLKEVQREVIEYYLNNGKEIPRFINPNIFRHIYFRVNKNIFE